MFLIPVFSFGENKKIICRDENAAGSVNSTKRRINKRCAIRPDIA